MPDGFAVGVYFYSVNFIDDYGNSKTDSITFTVGEKLEGAIPIGNFFLIFIGFSVIGLLFVKKRQIFRESR